MGMRNLVAAGLDSLSRSADLLSLIPEIELPKKKVKKVTGKEIVESAWNEAGRCLSNACYLKVSGKAHGKRAKKRDRVG